MIRKWLTGVLWALMAGGLYFFENNTGTRIVLAASLLLPAVSFAFRKEPAVPRRGENSAQTVTEAPEDTEMDGVRVYVPGDPIGRIHWKLSAKTDRLLVRQEVPAGNGAAVDASVPFETESEGAAQKSRSGRKRVCLLLALLALLLALLTLIPEARRGAAALCNRLFDLSERSNPYVYDRLPVPEGQGIALAAVLLLLALGVWCAILAVTGSAWFILPTALVLAGGQAYFGVSLPAVGNAAAFFMLGIKLLRPASRRGWLACGLALLFIAGAVALVWPGTDAATEAASERVRDRFSQAAGRAVGSVTEAPADGFETRHVNPRFLAAGDHAGRTERTYRLVTVEETQISSPRRINWLKTALLLLAAAALLTLPFSPFLWLNSRRKKAEKARQAFDSDNAGEATAAMFRHAIAWLEAVGCDPGNLLFRQWTNAVQDRFSPDYAARFARCAALFEEAAYSGHPITEEKRAQMRAFLEETEGMLYARADWKQRFRIRYERCLRV